MSDNPEGKELKRVIGIPGLAFTVVNFTIGAGIYVLPALIGIQLGMAGSIAGFILCAIMFAAIMLCYVEIGSRIKTSGGSYAYVETVFGPFAGFIINGLFIFGWGILGDAAIMNVVADSLAVLFPVFANSIPRIALFIISLLIMVLVNIRGVKNGIRVVSIITMIKIIPLIAIIIFGFFISDFSPAGLESLPQWSDVGATSLILFFAFAGFETSLNLSGEIKNPESTIPRGLLLGGGLVLIIYILLQVVVNSVLKADLALYKDAPLAAVANKLIGGVGTTILVVTAMISGLGSVNGDVLASPRMMYAGAMDGLLPKYLGKIHPRFATPHYAIISYAILIVICCVSGGFRQLAVLASGALLLIYLAVVFAVIRLRFKKNNKELNSFRIPGGIIVPLIAVATILWVLSNLTGQEYSSIAIFVLVLALIYGTMQFLKKNKVN